MQTVTTALCVIPPAEFHEAINAVRQHGDKAFPRWMPHLNLVYPCLREDDAVRSRFFQNLHRALVDVKPFAVNLRSIETFSQGSGFTVHVSPDDSDGFQQLYQAIAQVYPNQLPPKLKPHLTLAQFPLPDNSPADTFLSTSTDVQDLIGRIVRVLPNIAFTVENVAFISRSADDSSVPFEVRHQFRLGAARSAIPRRLVCKEKSVSVSDSSILDSAVKAVAAWLRRMPPIKLPLSIGALANAIVPFCKVRVQLNVDEVIESLQRAGLIRHMTLKQKPKPVAAPVRGKRPQQQAPSSEPGYQLFSGKGRTSPPSKPPLFGDSEALQQRLAYFIYRQGQLKPIHRKTSFVAQLRSVATLTAEIDPNRLIDALKERRIVNPDDAGVLRYLTS